MEVHQRTSGTYVRQDEDEKSIVAHLAEIVEKKFKDVRWFI